MLIQAEHLIVAKIKGQTEWASQKIMGNIRIGDLS